MPLSNHSATSAADRERLNAATDLAQLDRWFDRALTAATTAEIFAD
jgi:hypothetical protein